MKITIQSDISGKVNTLEIDITEDQLYKVKHRRELGLKIQDIVPDIPKDQREFLMTGITNEEWNEVFPKQ